MKDQMTKFASIIAAVYVQNSGLISENLVKIVNGTVSDDICLRWSFSLRTVL